MRGRYTLAPPRAFFQGTSWPPLPPPPQPASLPLPSHPQALWCVAHSIVSAFRSAQFEWQAVTDQFPAKAARQAGVTGQEGI